MNKNFIFTDPNTKEKLSLHKEVILKDQVTGGILVNKQGDEYKVTDGIPDFRDKNQKYEWLEYYEKNAATYDDYNHLTFILQGFDETETRNKVVSKLEIKKDERILEVGCGTGRDTVIINEHLQNTGELYLVDLSESMLKKCKEKLSSRNSITEFVLADSMTLPFPDNYFDKAFSFVTLPSVSDKTLFIKEITRVTKPGGKVLIGSEGMMPSLKNTLFGKLIISNCDLYNNELPLEEIPVNARNLKIEWILNGIIFLLEFDVAENEPVVSSMTIPGKRGGTFYSRYFGKLEGVTPETKSLALEAMKKSNITNHEWLSNVIIKAAKEMNNND